MFGYGPTCPYCPRIPHGLLLWSRMGITDGTSRTTRRDAMEAGRTSDELLSLVDTACLRIEDRTCLIVNAGAMVFAEPLDFERVKEALGQRFLGFHRFCQRVVWPELPLGTPHWEDDSLFDLGSHLHRIALPAPGDDRALEEVLSDLTSTPLDRAIPLWQVHLIENYGDGCVLLFRLHHCLADGMALLRVLRAITDRDPETPRTVPAPARRPPRDEDRLQAVVQLLTAGVHSLLGGTEVMLHKGAEALLHPDQGRDLARTAAGAATTLGRLLLLEPDSATHGNVAPAQVVPLASYEADIAATRPDWQEDET